MVTPNFSPSLHTTAVELYPTNVADCIARIDNNFGDYQTKQLVCQTFVGLNVSAGLDAMAMGASAEGHPILAKWCTAKANALRGVTNDNWPNPATEVPPFPKNINECIANIDNSLDSVNKQLGCEFLLSEYTTASALELAAESAEKQGRPIYAAWCRQAAKAKKSGTSTGNTTYTNEGLPPLPKTQNECLLNIDASMPQTEKLAACAELFNDQNKAQDYIDFADEANAAGYPIIKNWFIQKAGNLQEKADYTMYYYIGGGALAFLLALGIGIAIVKK